MQDELSDFAEHLIALVPDAVEAQHFAVEFQELAQFVVVARRLRNLRRFGLFARGSVWIVGSVLRRIYIDTFALEILLITSKHSAISGQQPASLSNSNYCSRIK